MKNAIEQIYKHRTDFMLIGLTGKIGSGCTTSANFLTESKDKHNLNPLCLDSNSSDSHRKKFILDKYYRDNWKSFYKITASDVIFSFILENKFEVFNSFLVNNGYPDISTNLTLQNHYNEFYNKYSNMKLDIKDRNFSNVQHVYSYLEELSCIAKVLRGELLNSKYRNYTKIFQQIGDNLRQYGTFITDLSCKSSSNIFTISERINQFIKIIKSYNDTYLKQPTYIVIDAFRNPFEIMYFKERYSGFYLIAVNADEEHIKDRLYKNLDMSKNEIEEQSKKENPSDSLESLNNFISQNIQACIQKADIHIANNGLSSNNNHHELYGQLIKYISLIQHPGLITPSLDEKMMQIAYTAKLNSACLSRQVGAAITNENNSLKAIGWNSVADGQTPCLLRSKTELLQGTLSDSYSPYEKSDVFKASVIKFYPQIINIDLKGRNDSFCFKTIYNKQEDDKNQVHTRSLHAEENAFLQIAKYGGEGIINGTLYSTASPCELCSKKAYQLGIKRVVYIDPYPGIAQKQILLTGRIPPKLELFKGAIGSAYHKLYEPIMSYKDELNALSKKDSI